MRGRDDWPAHRGTPAGRTAIEKNRTEIDVAPIAVRATGKLAGLAPGAITGMNRRFGGRTAQAHLLALGDLLLA